MWLQNCWYVAAYSTEIGHQPLSRRILDQPLVLFRLSSGLAVALQDRCPHRFLPLSRGRRIGDELECAYHGMRFSGDGRCTRIPGQATIPDNARAITYPLTERYGLAWIWMGAHDQVDANRIPDIPWMDHEGWRPSSGYHHFNCDYRLVTDNLLDLSHETYVHRHTIGNNENQTIADFPLHVSVDSHVVVRAHREMSGIEPPPFFAMILNTTMKIDRWQTAVYLPPSVHMTEAGVHLSGSTRLTAYVSRVMHLLTPETARSTHYFWSVNRNYALGDQAMTVAVRQSVSDTFDEDKDILELQQRAILSGKEERIPRFASKLDDAPLRARRALGTLLQAEQESTDFVVPVLPLVPDESQTPAMTATHRAHEYGR